MSVNTEGFKIYSDLTAELFICNINDEYFLSM